MNTTSRFDDEDRFAWHQIDSVYDPLGALDSRTTLYDNGTVKEEDFQNDTLVSKSVFDDTSTATGNYVWNRIDTYYDPLGSVSNKVTFYDDGRVKDESYVDGVRTMTSQYDNPGATDGNGAKSWDRIDTMYDENGARESQVTFYDDGVVIEDTYVDGVITTKTQYDNPQEPDGNGARAWDRIDNTYDANGQLESRVTFYDDGTVKEDLWENGVRTGTTQYDNPQDPEGPGAKSWDRVDTTYDENGVRDSKITFYDDGRVLEQLWTDGIRTSTVHYDNPQDAEGPGAKGWDTIETFYDPNGEITSKVTTFDDGTAREDVFEFNQRVSSTHQDFSSVKDWMQIETFYDAFGNREARITQFDDGRLNTHEYQFGQLVTSITEDAPFTFGNGAYDWSATGTLYENGERVSTSTVFDNGDRVVNDYEGDRLVRLVEIDGDFSEPWHGRVTTYDLDGTATVEHHFFEFTLPEYWDMGTAQDGGDSIL